MCRAATATASPIGASARSTSQRHADEADRLDGGDAGASRSRTRALAEVERKLGGERGDVARCHSARVALADETEHEHGAECVPRRTSLIAAVLGVASGRGAQSGSRARMQRGRDAEGHEAERQDEEHRHEHELSSAGAARPDLELDARASAYAAMSARRRGPRRADLQGKRT